jgi:hypothetical protein
MKKMSNIKVLPYPEYKLSGQTKFFGLVIRIIIVCLHLTPYVSLFPGVPKVRLEDIVILSSLLWFLKQNKIQIVWGWHQLLHCSFPIFILTSILVGSLKGYESSFADLNQFIRIFKYLYIYTITLTYIHIHPEPDLERIRVLKFMSYVSFFLSLVVLQQYFNLFGLNQIYGPIFFAQSLYLIEGGQPRPIGMIGNPNEVGFMFAINILITILLILKENQQNKLYWGLLFLQIMSISSTLSRGAVIGALVGILMLIIGYLANKKLRITKNVIKIFIVIAILLTTVNILSTNEVLQEKIFFRFALLEKGTDEGSLQGRVDQAWPENIALIQASPIFGVGPLRRAVSDITIDADNEWLLLVRSYGIVGTLYLMICFVFPQIISKKCLSTTLLSTKLLGKCCLVTTLLYMIPAAVYYNLVLMPIVLIVLSTSDTSGKKFTIQSN